MPRHRFIVLTRHRHRFIVLTCTFAILVGAGWGFWLFTFPPDYRISRANFDRLDVGMPRAQVEGLIGPPADFTAGKGSYHSFREDYQRKMVIAIRNLNPFNC